MADAILTASGAVGREFESLRAHQFLVAVPCPIGLAAANFPEAFILIIELQQAIARVVALAAVGAGNEAANVQSPTIVILSDRKTGAATARDEKHAKSCLVQLLHLSVPGRAQVLLVPLSRRKCVRASAPAVSF